MRHEVIWTQPPPIWPNLSVRFVPERAHRLTGLLRKMRGATGRLQFAGEERAHERLGGRVRGLEDHEHGGAGEGVRPWNAYRS